MIWHLGRKLLTDLFSCHAILTATHRTSPLNLHSSVLVYEINIKENNLTSFNFHFSPVAVGYSGYQIVYYINF